MVGQFAIKTYPVARAGQPFSRAGLFMGQAPKAIRPVVPTNRYMGQTAQTIQALIAAGMTKDQAIVERNKILNTAATEMLNSGRNVENNLDNVYNGYNSYGITAWVRTYASQVVLPLVGPMIDSWLQASSAQKARTIIMSSLTLAENWQNGIKNKFMPAFLDEIEAMDSGLAKQIDSAFEAVSKKYQRNVDLMTGLTKPAQVWFGQGAAIFFPALYKQIGVVLDKFASLAQALDALLKAFLEMTESASKAARAAPYFVLGGMGIIAVWLLLR